MSTKNKLDITWHPLEGYEFTPPKSGQLNVYAFASHIHDGGFNEADIFLCEHGGNDQKYYFVRNLGGLNLTEECLRVPYSFVAWLGVWNK
jgi:hypothetical protein